MQRILDAFGNPAVARAAYGDYVAANALGHALYAPLFESPEQPANSARFTFLDPAATEFYPDWDRVASDLVAHLRSEAGPNSYDRALTDLVGELSTRSEEFRRLWAAHNVRFHRTGIKRIQSPDRRRDGAQFRGDGARRRPRAGDQRLHRRTWQPLRRSATPLASWTAGPAGAPTPAEMDSPDREIDSAAGPPLVHTAHTPPPAHQQCSTLRQPEGSSVPEPDKPRARPAKTDCPTRNSKRSSSTSPSTRAGPARCPPSPSPKRS